MPFNKDLIQKKIIDETLYKTEAYKRGQQNKHENQHVKSILAGVCFPENITVNYKTYNLKSIISSRFKYITWLRITEILTWFLLTFKNILINFFKY